MVNKEKDPPPLKHPSFLALRLKRGLNAPDPLANKDMPQT